MIDVACGAAPLESCAVLNEVTGRYAKSRTNILFVTRRGYISRHGAAL